MAESGEVIGLKAFVPAKDFEQSTQFYTDLGFVVESVGDGVSEVHVGTFRFLLQDYYVEDWAANCMLQLTVDDLDAWWARIDASKVAENYAGIRAVPPAADGSANRIAYLTDPAGICWNIVEA